MSHLKLKVALSPTLLGVRVRGDHHDTWFVDDLRQHARLRVFHETGPGATPPSLTSGTYEEWVQAATGNHWHPVGLLDDMEIEASYSLLCDLLSQGSSGGAQPSLPGVATVLLRRRS